jgi:hypothetical protein
VSRSVSAVRASLSGFCRLYLKREPSNVESLNLPLPLAHTVLSYAAAEARLRRLPPMVLSPYECGSSRTPHTSRSVVGIHDALGISRNLELSKIARQAPEDELVLSVRAPHVVLFTALNVIAAWPRVPAFRPST